MNPIISLMGVFWDNNRKQDNKRIKTLNVPDGIKEVCNIPYIDDGNRYHLLDVYYPENTDKKLPVIIDIHGGGWMYGDKELNKIYCFYLAKRGFTVFNISYRLVPSAFVGEQLQDCAYALRWISEHMNDYPCDEKNIMLTGDSAGGMLAAYSAALMSSEKLRDIFETVNPKMKLTMLTLTSPVAYMNENTPVGFCSRMLWGKKWKSLRTVNYMNLDEIIDMASFPPTVFVTSSGDILARPYTRRAAEDFKKRNIPCKLIDFEKFDGIDLQHVFAVLLPESKAGKLCIDNYISFYKELINSKKEDKGKTDEE